MTGGLWSGPGPDRRPNRALPEWAIDKLLFGVARRPRRQRSPQGLGECIRIAMSAYRRRWTRNEFVDEVTKCGKKKDA
jgi:hypothetical protein